MRSLSCAKHEVALSGEAQSEACAIFPIRKVSEPDCYLTATVLVQNKEAKGKGSQGQRPRISRQYEERSQGKDSHRKELAPFLNG